MATTACCSSTYTQKSLIGFDWLRWIKIVVLRHTVQLQFNCRCLTDTLQWDEKQLRLGSHYWGLKSCCGWMLSMTWSVSVIRFIQSAASKDSSAKLTPLGSTTLSPKMDKTWVLAKRNETGWYFCIYLDLILIVFLVLPRPCASHYTTKNSLYLKTKTKREASPLLWPSICHQGRRTELWWSFCERKRQEQEWRFFVNKTLLSDFLKNQTPAALTCMSNEVVAAKWVHVWDYGDLDYT